MFEQQKGVIEERYRTLLEDSVQDAVFLSTRNTELMQENQDLKQGNIPMYNGKFVKIFSIILMKRNFNRYDFSHILNWLKHD